MEINYFILIPFALAAIILLVFMIKRNKKDEKKFEEKMNQDKGEPESHPTDRI